MRTIAHLDPLQNDGQQVRTADKLSSFTSHQPYETTLTRVNFSTSVGTASVSQFSLCLHQPQDFPMFSFSDQSFPSRLDLLLGKHYLVRTVMIHYQIDDITANTQSRFSSHLKWHNSINLNSIIPAYNKCKTDDENTNTYYNTAVLLKQAQEIRHSLTFEEDN